MTNRTDTHNDRSPADIYWGPELIEYSFICSVILGLLIMTANIFPIMALKRTPALRKHPSNILLGFLAAIDITCAFRLIFFGAQIRYMEYSAFDCRARVFMYGPPYMAGCMMVTLSIDRLLAICKPLKYRAHLGKKYAIILGFSPIIYGQAIAGTMSAFADWDTKKLCLPHIVVPEEVYILASTCHIVVGIATLTALNVKVLIIARKHARAIYSECGEGRKDFIAELKAYKLVGSVVLMCFIFYAPYVVLTEYERELSQDHASYKRITQGSRIASLLMYINNFLNPFIYAFRLTSFRSAYSKMLIDVKNYLKSVKCAKL